MILKNRLLAILFLVMVVGNGTVFSQSTNSLKAKRQKLEKEITYTSQLLQEINRSKQNTVYELQLISKRIAMRERLVQVLKEEITQLSDSILSTSVSLKALNRRLDTLKKEYVQIAWYLYKNDNSYNRLIFLFSAKDFNQAYQRLRYLDEISSYIRKEAGRIQKLEALKKEKLSQLMQAQARKKKLLNRETTQLSKLQYELHQKRQVQKKLTKKERNLRARLREKQKESQRLDAQIKKAIAAARKSAASKSVKHHAEESRLSSSFAANKGRLPWPVKHGVVSLTFGVHHHPVLKHVQIKNNGINIATAKGSRAYAVFQGKVVNIVVITHTNKAVILKHGEYYTVYSGLDQILVRKNQQVKRGQVLGVIHTSLQGKTELHFEVWHNKILQNPAYWLKKNP
ncbi:peptidoglycan DD-metalloendopeptidase family protein [Candidatus Sulfidibacterium hydrothermale]|uniref:murein hydrolase activator EnvC family protein n=1 Tax=Candidatus Sulfidibacterium hydrothermale TaxID=2875962 RepID=UPI001F0B5EF7|nr:peptidoglycan DD-metalloendopeptidase family protein [Candidatus Sulfidibacterium hydrothermale]UBM62600.1 peptidoglycan DD-metalloendopeptidase family protein [Candidatus Sulfidibacterium hydrothermale]